MRDEDLDPDRRSSSVPAAGRDKFPTHGALIFLSSSSSPAPPINNREASPLLHPGSISVRMCGSVGNTCRRRNVEFKGTRGTQQQQPLSERFLEWLKDRSAFLISYREKSINTNTDHPTQVQPH